MNVSLTNEVIVIASFFFCFLIDVQGPVTFTLDTRKFEYVAAAGDNNSSRKGGRTAVLDS